MVRACRLASIPQSFNVKTTQAFDPAYMKALFEVGHNLGQSSGAWARTPPEAIVLATQR